MSGKGTFSSSRQVQVRHYTVVKREYTNIYMFVKIYCFENSDIYLFIFNKCTSSDMS